MLHTISTQEALRYLGYGQNRPDAATEALIDICKGELLPAIRERYLYRSFSLRPGDEGLFVDPCGILLTGKSIATHLFGCHSVVLLCATLSDGVDRLIRRTQVTDMSNALILDALASAAIEQVCDMAERELKERLPGQFFTWRFSPGYGDLPLQLEQSILTALDAPRKIGLHANESHILVPRKSVTALIGVSDTQIERKQRGCVSCNLNQTCQFRRKGERCDF